MQTIITPRLQCIISCSQKAAASIWLHDKTRLLFHKKPVHQSAPHSHWQIYPWKQSAIV